MEEFKLYNYKRIEKLISSRIGEQKFGEKITFLNHIDELQGSKAKYVLFGIPEDIGVRANNGNAGTSTAWEVCLKSLLNTQANQFTNPENIILLGEVNCDEINYKASNIGEEDPNYLLKLGDLVSQLDDIVSGLVEIIVNAGKIPVVIGGGHNNAFGIIKGASKALKKVLNVINIDAHTDLRNTDFRHSGNGFSYARNENYLGKYRVFGLHKNYTPQYIFNALNASTMDHYYLFEHLILKSSAQINTVFQEELSMTAQEEFGLELDCDAISKFPSSAQTPSGFSFNLVRNFIALAAREENIKYLHICEAAPSSTTKFEVGKALSYLVTDFTNPG